MRTEPFSPIVVITMNEKSSTENPHGVGEAILESIPKKRTSVAMMALLELARTGKRRSNAMTGNASAAMSGRVNRSSTAIENGRIFDRSTTSA